MSFDDENPVTPPASNPESDGAAKGEEPLSLPPVVHVVSGADAGFVAPPESPAKEYPADLQISWSWPHFLVFGIFAFCSLIVVNLLLILLYAPERRMTGEQFERYLMGKPEVLFGSMLLLYGLIFFFLYVTVTMLRGVPFWRSLGWRSIQPRKGELPKNPLIYFVTGCGLSLLVTISTSRMKTPENMPIEQIFTHRNVAFAFMGMAVLVAPLVEETLFRGYIYPSLARFICSILEWRGVEHDAALGRGVAGSIMLTGVLFGLMHGAQLGWTWALVSVLIFVGIVFTIVRARTGSVVASYLMHLGYNSLISAFAILGTHGFTKLPPH
jgi:membrane protease YdiL (CAAX protease family)